MAQHDMNIANQGFPATRADLNNALQALVSNSSGTSAPSTTFANQWWYDTTNNKMYIRNEANNAWIEVAHLIRLTMNGSLQLELFRLKIVMVLLLKQMMERLDFLLKTGTMYRFDGDYFPDKPCIHIVTNDNNVAQLTITTHSTDADSSGGPRLNVE